MNNKWIRGAIPALLVHLSIGAVYCWSLLKGEIANAANISVSSIEFAFSLAIFFLGMSAAFMGPYIEKNVKKSTVLSGIFYSAGLLGTVISIYYNSIIGIFISYGVIMGIGLGIGYLSPVKTLMLWFSKNKGLATGIAIMGFGLSKAIYSPFIEYGINNFGINYTLLYMALISLCCILLASYLIEKPKNWKETGKISISIFDFVNKFKESNFRYIWLFFFINIMCGLCIIAFEKDIVNSIGLITFAALISSVSAIFNAGGRFISSTISDYLNSRKSVYIWIFNISAIISLLSIFINPIIGIVLIMIINFGYGGGFSTMPSLLTEYYDMKKISTIHGYVLSAWAMASIASYLFMQLFVYRLNLSFSVVIPILSILYIIGLIFTLKLKKVNK